MFARLRALVLSFKKKETESENIVIMQPENDALREELLDNNKKVAEWLKPAKENWNTIEDVLLWKSPLPACVCFLLISGFFWKFISMRLRKPALALGGFLLANGISDDFRTGCWDFFHKNLNLNVKEQRSLPFSFEELSLYIASIWLLITRSIRFVKSLHAESSSKYYCFLAVSLFGILTLFTYFPVAEFLYVMTCFLFFYPSLNYIGVIDKLNARIDLLTGPVLRHWEHSRTKRKRNTRNTRKQERQRYEIADTDDEFLPENNEFTNDVLASVVPNEDTTKAISNNHDDFYASESDSQEDEFSDSNFERGLSMPSMSKFDSMMEPLDEFHGGLVFPDHNKSLRNTTYNILEAAANNADTDEEVDDLPYDDHKDGPGLEQFNLQGPRSERLSHPALENELRYRRTPRADRNNAKCQKIPQENTDYGDSSEADVQRMIETDFEFLEHSDADDMNLIGGPASIPSDDIEKREAVNASGITAVSNWFGYK